MNPVTQRSDALLTPAIVVTGASSGIGREIARVAARDRMPLLLVARSHEALLDLAKQVEASRTEAGSSRSTCAPAMPPGASNRR